MTYLIKYAVCKKSQSNISLVATDGICRKLKGYIQILKTQIYAHILLQNILIPYLCMTDRVSVWLFWGWPLGNKLLDDM